MTGEGALSLELRVESARVASVGVVSSRRTDISSALQGMDLSAALALVPSLFSICGAAHAVAALEACEAALGVEVAPGQRDARRLLCALEAMDNHAFQVCVEWPKLLGEEPAVGLLRRERAATQSLARWVAPDARWARLGGVALGAREPVEERLAALRAVVAELAPEAALRDAPARRAWMAQRGGPAAAFLFSVEEGGGADFGASTAPLVPELPASWFAERLASPDFGARPTLDGRPAEAGAVALTADQPAVAELLASRGRTVGTRLLAKLADVRRLADAVEVAAPALTAAGPAAPPQRDAGAGAGVADTARGRLAHAVAIEAGRVARWRTVAPTEWTFHPAGVVQEALMGASAEAIARRTEWLVAALDPCVPCAAHVQGVG